MLDDQPLRLVGIQHGTEEDMRIFQSTDAIYDMVWLKRSGCPVANVAMQVKKIQFQFLSNSDNSSQKITL